MKVITRLSPLKFSHANLKTAFKAQESRCFYRYCSCRTEDGHTVLENFTDSYKMKIPKDFYIYFLDKGSLLYSKLA